MIQWKYKDIKRLRMLVRESLGVNIEFKFGDGGGQRYEGGRGRGDGEIKRGLIDRLGDRVSFIYYSVFVNVFFLVVVFYLVLWSFIFYI